MLIRSLIATVFFAAVAAGCAPVTVGLSDTRTLAPDTASQCLEHCTSIGLDLTAVVIMADEAGCVCEKGANADAPAKTWDEEAVESESSEPVGIRAAVSGGLAMVMKRRAAAAAAQQQQTHQQNNRSQYTPPTYTPPTYQGF